MGLIDNPLFSAVGEHLGLGELFDSAAKGATSATENAGAEAPIRAGVSKPNIPEYRNRPYLPRAMGGVSGLGQAPGGSNPVVPGAMDPQTLQNNAALLAQYGVQAPQTPPDPNLFVHNPEAFNRHPILAGLLEHGLEGIAYAHPGQNALESLIGGVRGMQEAQAARAQQVNAQVMAPIQQAQAVQELQKVKDAHDAHQAEMDYKKGLLLHYHNADLYNEGRIKFDPKTGQPFQLQEDENGKLVQTPVPGWKENPHDALTRQYYELKKDALVKKYGSIDQIPADELSKALFDFESQESMAKGAAGRANAKERANATRYAADKRAQTAAAKAANPGGGKWSESDKNLYKDLTTEDKSLEREITTAQNTHNMISVPDERDPNKEVMLVPRSKEHLAYLQRRQARRNQIAQQKQQLQQKYNGGAAPAAGPKEGDTKKNSSGDSIVFRNGKWGPA